MKPSNLKPNNSIFFFAFNRREKIIWTGTDFIGNYTVKEAAKFNTLNTLQTCCIYISNCVTEKIAHTHNINQNERKVKKVIWLKFYFVQLTIQNSNSTHTVVVGCCCSEIFSQLCSSIVIVGSNAAIAISVFV